MNDTYTETDLILYLYGELPEGKKEKIEKEIENDPALKGELMELGKIYDQLNFLKRNPHPTSVEIVLESSESAKSLETY